ncbi:MAG: DUF3090 domain-containing protein [Leptolinea sp.]
MPRIEMDLDPITHITTDAIGQPGQRTFYLQAWQENKAYTLLVEKIQIQSLAIGFSQFLDEVAVKHPQLPPASADFNEDKMHIIPPVDPLFRVGEIGLAFDSDRDLIIIVVREILGEELDQAGASVLHIWCTRSQLKALCAWGLEVINRGRPLCPQCGEPMEPSGHFCPKKNGHKH